MVHKELFHFGGDEWLDNLFEVAWVFPHNEKVELVGSVLAEEAVLLLVLESVPPFDKL